MQLKRKEFYHKDGKLKAFYYVNEKGQKYGLNEVYNHKGILMYKGHWKNDRRVGLWLNNMEITNVRKSYKYYL